MSKKTVSFKKITKGLKDSSSFNTLGKVVEHNNYDIDAGFKHLTEQVNGLIERVNAPSSRADADTYKGQHGDIKINKIGPNRYEFYIRGEGGWYKDNNASFGPLNKSAPLNDPPVINMTSGQIDYGYQGNDRLTLNLDPTKISTASVATPSVKAWGNLKLESTGHVILSPTNNVGIGTTNPQTLLHLTGTGGATSGITFTNAHDDVDMYFNNNSNDSGFFITYVGTGGAELELQADGDLILNGSNGDNVGIGTASPTTKLDVDGTVSYKHTAFTTAGPTDGIDVSDTTVLEVDTSSNNVTIGGFSGGVAGQILYIVKTDTANFIQLEHNESPAVGSHQKIYLTSGSDERVVGYGGYTLYCNGTHWYSLSNPTGAADAG
tara:strand:- start:12451 stop:13584 length:1134 start_codon:yes stop_codon:yes gene_type:complete